MFVYWNKDTPEAIKIIRNAIKSSIKKLELELKTNKNEMSISSIEFKISVLEKQIKFLTKEIPSLSEDEYRYLGITLVCHNKYCHRLKFPIKFVKDDKTPYDEIIGFSNSTQ